MKKQHHNTNKKYVTLISLVVALGGFLLGFDSAVISGTIKGISTTFDMSDAMLGFAVGCVIFGAMAGNLLAGPAADKYGRRTVLILVAALFTISALWSSLASSYIEFITARIIGGIGIGGAILIAPIYIAEIAPAYLRGRLVSFNQLNIVIGISIAYFTNYFLMNMGEQSWRFMLAVEAIPALLYLVFLFFVPKSPRWLLLYSSNREKALETLTKISGSEQAAITLKNIGLGLSRDEKKGRLRDLFNFRFKTIMLIAFGIAFFQQITGINAIFYYAPTIFEQAGGSADSSFIQAIAIGLTNLVFTLVAMAVIDRAGRKPLLLLGTAMMTVALSLAAIAFHQATYTLKSEGMSKIDNIEMGKKLLTLENKIYHSQHELFTELKPLLSKDEFTDFQRNQITNFISVNSTLVLIAIMLYVAAFAISLGPVMWALISEIFPTHIKGIAVSLVGFFNSLVSFSVTQVFPWELSTLGPDATFTIYGVLALFACMFIQKFVVETKGKTLEEIEAELVK